MPNWCWNEVTIDGSRLDLKAFAAKGAENSNDEEDLSLLRAFIPMPEEYVSFEGYNNGGYEWCIRNWGTKWAESSIEMSGENFGDTAQAKITFESPWNPPLTGYSKISEMFPTLTFIHYWDEPGMCFAGITVMKAGEEIMMEEVVDEDYPYMLDHENEDEYYARVFAVKDQLFSAANAAIKSLT